MNKYSVTFGERRKRADSKQIVADMDALESSFLKTTQKLNEKRRGQLKKRLTKLLPELEKKFDSGEVEDVERILETLKMPSSREWYKATSSLIDSSARTGVLRAHFELQKLRGLYEFNEVSIKEGANSFKVVFPAEAEDFVKQYGYQIGVITEETSRQRIRDSVMDSLHEGTRGRDLTQKIFDTTDTWVSQTHAETIARTETAKMYNAGRVARYTDPAQDGFVEALQYDSIVDTRTTDLCEGLNGKVIDINDSGTIAKMTPPNHFRCRATWVAVSRYEEWQDDFPRGEDAQEGFEFESPLPALLKGSNAKEPLVQPVKPVPTSNAKSITDPLLIRNLDDDGFREAIGNITDEKMKYYLVKERSEQIALNSNMIEVSRGIPQFKGGIYNDDSVRFQLSPNAKYFKFQASQTVQFEMDDLFKLMAKDPTNQSHINKAIDAFVAKNSGDRAFIIANKQLLEAKRLGVVDVKFNGFVTHKMTKEAEDLIKFKMPARLTPTYKKDLVIQANKESAEKFLLANLHPKLAPSHGIEFKYNGRTRRAFARGNTINLGPRTGAEVIVHEAGHVIHDNKEIQKLVNTFFRERTEDLKMGSSSLMGEKVIRDDFYHPYIGRIYGWEGKEMFGQEVLSMGLQAMYENPAKFYREDKEHFMLINAIMGGLF